MLGLGWTEMLVIGVVALIFIGPKDLPVVMGRVGKVIGQIQRMGREFQREINKTTGLDEVRNLRTSITSPLKQTADEIRKEFNAIGKDGKEAPSGALKPTDPTQESVVEAIQQQAGMAPKKTNDEMAAEYGFTSSKSEPVKAAPRTAAKPAPATNPAKPAAARTASGKAAASKPASGKAAPAKAATKSTAKDQPADAAATAAAKSPKARASKAAAPSTSTAASEKPATAKPARKTPAKKVAKAGAEEAAKPAKPRAPRKKAAATAGKTE
ncbi:Sec-independent protein translocase protein TatB [uncultured Devosia sp.]|uniref:Sec-independent protein translocase protein TatB n=1 Tax=uncultured Devosia sp. TaxID=211434 RepID=UPI002608712B|nr:Sec-independent protein translocase protein TatB [uncultured Devosia sp.]